MKKGSLIIVLLCLLTAACSSMKKQTETKTEPMAALTGTWVLDIVPYTQGTFDSLYPQSKPSLSFNLVQKTFTGHTSCNTINGALVVADNKAISFKGDIAMTRMACIGDGESVFMQYLKRINKYAISADGNQLTLIQGDMALMRFHKK